MKSVYKISPMPKCLSVLLYLEMTNGIYVACLETNNES